MTYKVALYQLIGDKIKSLRNSFNINQEELSNLAQISRSTISNIESGKHSISLDTLYTIAEKLKTQVHILLPTEIEIEEKMSKNDRNVHFVSELERKNISLEDIELIKRSI